MWTTPTRCDITPLWETISENRVFLLQKSKGAENILWKSVVDTFQNVFDTKQFPYRILLKKHEALPSIGESADLISVSASFEEIQAEWKMAERWAFEVMKLDSFPDVYFYCSSKVESLLATFDRSHDEVSTDEKFRNAARAFRSIFNVPDSERLVNFYSCAREKFQNQGWLYVSSF